MRRTRSFAFLFATLLQATLSAADPNVARQPIILDTDIGTAVDDTFALGLAVACPELELRAVTTVTQQAEDRAWMVCRFLTHVDRAAVSVAFGREPQPASPLGLQVQYRRHPAVVWNRTLRPAEDAAVKVMHDQLKAARGKLTLICVGPLTNVAQLLTTHPEARPWIKRIVVMGGALDIGYGGQPPAAAEWNIRSDIAAAKTVFQAGVPLLVVPLDATVGVTLDDARRERLFARHSPLTHQIAALYQLADEPRPTLFDPVAVALAVDESFAEWTACRLVVDDRGLTKVVAGRPNARVARSLDRERFLDWYVSRIVANGPTVLPQPPGNPSVVIRPNGLPQRVHVFEDYETDIESRWWLAGRLETNEVPAGSRRACRAVLTQDFDARMGDTKTMYKAVVFNPVPGPPMGARTRLRFRYKLQGTDTIRVQLFSLSRGFHRYLSLAELPQGTWSEATVDMTAMRRPDGTGGPLAADERIDDIQFYIDPRADLWIDDIVLYEAAATPPNEPFPARFLFTGWFDTGKQGQEWPGDFEIVLHDRPRTWDMARSVLHAKTKMPWMRIQLRGQRRLGESTRLRFQYRLDGPGRLHVVLVNSETNQRYEAVTADLQANMWSDASLDFPVPEAADEDRFVNEIQLTSTSEAEFAIDDLLLYVPGEEPSTSP